MCGRYALYCNLPRLMAIMEVIDHPPFAARYNIAPTQDAPIVTRGKDGLRHGLLARWGLVPHWSRGPDHRFSMINARADTLAEKPAYRQAYRNRRCLVPASGFYEWRREDGGRKQPCYITRRDGEPMVLAGLWAVWRDNDDRPLTSFTIVTTGANAVMRPIHERMPVILEPAHWHSWLGTGEPAATPPPSALLDPAAAGTIQAHPVSTRVNSPAHDGPDCIEPIDD